MILVKPYLNCSNRCAYCYQRYIHSPAKYDRERVMDTVRRLYDRMKGEVVLHGGEPLEMPIEDVEYFLDQIYRLTGRTSIQTNAVNITEKHIELFKRYRTSVGVSCDGLDGAEVRPNTDRTLKNIELLRENSVDVSLIVVLSKANIGSDDKLERLMRWLLDMKRIGITGGRLNPVQGSEYAPTVDELKRAYKHLLYFCMSNGLEYSPFVDIRNALLGRGNVVCSFRPCDPYATPSAVVVLGDGSVTNCMRTNERRILLRADDVDLEMRQYVLRNYDCKGCPWWAYCYGGCPSFADWREKNPLCPVWKFLFGVMANIYGVKPKQVREPQFKPTARLMFYKGAEHLKEWVGRISRLHFMTELETVKRGLRDVATVHIDPWRMDEQVERLAREGLVFMPLRRTRPYSGFSHKHLPPASPQERFVWYGCVAKSLDRALEFREADRRGDHEKMGEMLGYPKCCVRFFQRVWSEGYYDPVWQMLDNSEVLDSDGYAVVRSSPFSNPILRYFGIRIVSHLPCSFSCPQSVVVGKEWYEVMKDLDERGAVMCWKLLRLATTWDSWKGFAIVETSLFHGVTNTYPYLERKVVKVVAD